VVVAPVPVPVVVVAPVPVAPVPWPPWPVVPVPVPLVVVPPQAAKAPARSTQEKAIPKVRRKLMATF
jgi:hypothetical protein